MLKTICFTDGSINGIDTPIVIDSGTKISVISDDFIDIDYEPVSFTLISGICQEPKSVPVFSLPVRLPTLEGPCLVAVDSRLPPRTVLLGLDFGTDNIVSLINYVKYDPQPVITVTRAMQVDSDLAAHASESLHSTEGASPIPFEDIPLISEEIEPSSTLPSVNCLIPSVVDRAKAE